LQRTGALKRWIAMLCIVLTAFVCLEFTLSGEAAAFSGGEPCVTHVETDSDNHAPDAAVACHAAQCCHVHVASLPGANPAAAPSQAEALRPLLSEGPLLSRAPNGLERPPRMFAEA